MYKRGTRALGDDLVRFGFSLPHSPYGDAGILAAKVVGSIDQMELDDGNNVDKNSGSIPDSKSVVRPFDAEKSKGKRKLYIGSQALGYTVEAVEAVSKILATSGNECFRFHSYTSLEERTQILFDFQQKGGILVCTDAAARGLDVMNVSHVIQAEFARSAVDFLHRVGRTARAGQPGLVTSLYSDSNRDLVDAVRQAGTLDLPVENAFSRKRSFWKKIKKRGRSEVGETLSAGDRVLA